MACTEAYNKLWTHAIEKERAIQARQRKDYLKMLQEEAQGSRAPRKRVQRELAPGGGSPGGRGLGKSSSMPSLLAGSRPASSAGFFQPPIPGASLESTLSHTKPNHFVPVLDGTVSPKPVPGNRGLPPGYIAAVGTNMGVLMWPGGVSHKRRAGRPRTGLPAESPSSPEASPASPARAPSCPATPMAAEEGELQQFAPRPQAKPLVRRSMATSMGKMIWPQDCYFVG